MSAVTDIATIPPTGARPRELAATFASAAVATLACLLIAVALASRLAPAHRYTILGHPVLIVASGSMSPLLRTGDLLVDNPVSSARAAVLHAGQIVSFRARPGSTTVITHRIVAVVRRGGGVLYETKGDANDAPDPVLRTSSSVLGTYAGRLPRAGAFLVNLRRPLVVGLLLAAPLLWLGAAALRRLAREEETP